MTKYILNPAKLKLVTLCGITVHWVKKYFPFIHSPQPGTPMMHHTPHPKRQPRCIMRNVMRNPYPEAQPVEENGSMKAPELQFPQWHSSINIFWFSSWFFTKNLKLSYQLKLWPTVRTMGQDAVEMSCSKEWTPDSFRIALSYAIQPPFTHYSPCIIPSDLVTKKPQTKHIHCGLEHIYF